MPIQKVSFEDSLGRFVLPSRCIGCASCVVVCPFNCLEYDEGQPKIAKTCQLCGICAQVCPKFNNPMSDLERFVFGREKRIGEEFGIYRSISVVQASDENMHRFCQDGGAVTSLLTSAMNNGMIDSAAVSGVSEKEPLRPVPKLASNTADLLECAGTRYTYSPNIFALKEGITQKRTRIAFVGTPCQVNAMRRIQMVPLKKYSNAVVMTIGLFCSESFTYKGFINDCIQGTLGINARNVEKVNIKGKLLIKTRSGEIRTLPLKEAKKYASMGCRSCPDFSAELADISAGGLGLDDWTLTVIRTETGEKLLHKAQKEGMIRARPIEDEKDALNLLVKISKRKHEISREEP